MSPNETFTDIKIQQDQPDDTEQSPTDEADRNNNESTLVVQNSSPVN